VYSTDTVPANASELVPGFWTSRMKAVAFPVEPDALPDMDAVHSNKGCPTGQRPSELLLHGPAGAKETFAGEFVDQVMLIEAEIVDDRPINSGQDACAPMAGLSNDARVVDAGLPEMTNRLTKSPPPITARAAPTTTSQVRTRERRWSSQ